MIDVAKLKIGDKVHYQSSKGEYENGMVKSINEHGIIFVVYHCRGDWENYKDYTGASTNARDLHKGWRHD